MPPSVLTKPLKKRDYGCWRATFGAGGVVIASDHDGLHLASVSDPHTLTQLAIFAAPDGASLNEAYKLAMATPGSELLFKCPAFEIVLELSGDELATSFYFASDPDEGMILNYNGNGTNFAADIFDYLGEKRCQCDLCLNGTVRPHQPEQP